MSIAAIITQKLQQALSPVTIQVIDESHKHIGHVGARDSGETHFAIIVISQQFKGLSRLQRHKLIYSILDLEMQNNIHALSIVAHAPEEAL